MRPLHNSSNLKPSTWKGLICVYVSASLMDFFHFLSPRQHVSLVEPHVHFTDIKIDGETAVRWPRYALHESTTEFWPSSSFTTSAHILQWSSQFAPSIWSDSTSSSAAHSAELPSCCCDPHTRLLPVCQPLRSDWLLPEAAIARHLPKTISLLTSCRKLALIDGLRHHDI